MCSKRLPFFFPSNHANKGYVPVPETPSNYDDKNKVSVLVCIACQVKELDLFQDQ